MREKKRETCRLPDSKKKEKKGRKISKIPRKKPTFVENLSQKKRERERALPVNGRINQQVSKWREKSPRGAERSKNRGRLKSHKETEEEGGGIEFWWLSHRENFFAQRAFTRWERRGLSNELVSSPSLVPFFLFSFLPSEGGGEGGERVGRWLGEANQGSPSREGEELMKERDLRIPCKWRVWIIHSNKIMQRTSDRAKNHAESPIASPLSPSPFPLLVHFAEFAPLSPCIPSPNSSPLPCSRQNVSGQFLVVDPTIFF